MDSTKTEKTEDDSPEKLEVPENFADYAEWRKKDSKKGAGEDGKSSKQGDEDDPGDDDTPTDAESSGDDGGDAGKKTKNQKQTEGDPPWLPNRLGREKRKFEREKQKRLAVEKELQEYKAKEKQEVVEKDDTDKGQKSEEGTSIPPEEYDVDFPVEDDYDSDEEWLKDVDNWDNYRPLQYGPNAKKAGNKKPDVQKTAAPPQNDPPPPPVDEAKLLFEDVREVLEESDDADEDLSDNFFQQLQAGRFAISKNMLEWMADNEDAVLVAAEFVRSPRVANRIFRRPVGSQGKLLKELATRLKGGEAGKSKTSGRGKPIPVVEPLNTSGRIPMKRLEDAKDIGEYARLRKKMAS